MDKPKFKIWLENKLKETPSVYYNKDGNSSRAVVTRGIWREIMYQYKIYPKLAIYEIKSFSGLDTPIVYFLNLVIILLFSPIIPIIWGYYSYSRAIEEFKFMFENEENKEY